MVDVGSTRGMLQVVWEGGVGVGLVVAGGAAAVVSVGAASVLVTLGIIRYRLIVTVTRSIHSLRRIYLYVYERKLPAM